MHLLWLSIYRMRCTRWCTNAGETLVREPTGYTFSDFYDGQSQYGPFFDEILYKTLKKDILERNSQETSLAPQNQMPFNVSLNNSFSLCQPGFSL